jgi:hypothetical protein
MDTPRDIARDEWWQAHWGLCETCKHVKRGKTGHYYCNNEDLENYGLYSEDIEECDSWAEKECI